MKYLLIRLYGIIPKWIRNYLGSMTYLRFYRDMFLKQHGSYREVSALIQKTYWKNDVEFKFYGSVKDVSKALTSGIENKLLLNSIKLFENTSKRTQNIIGFDIGANFGYLSLVWSQTICYNNGKIYAFEPNEHVFNSLNRSIDKNQLNEKILPNYCAVGSENRDVNIFVDGTTSNININSETLKKANVIDRKVNMTTLDSFIESNQIEGCDFVKIDVDGIELDILNGSLATIKKFKPIFIIETNKDKRIIDFFEKSNYKILDMDLNTYVLDTELPLNIFCVPN